MKNKGLVIGLLLMLALVVSGATYAYWATAINVTDDTSLGTVTIGEAGAAVTTSVVVANLDEEELDLVPVGLGSPNFVEFVFDVEWQAIAGAVGATGTITVSNATYSVPGATLSGAQLEAMFTSSVQTAAEDLSITNGQTKQVTVRVTFDTEPADKDIYDLIKNATLTATFTFDVTVTP
jgi:hypothetical protein